MENDLTIRKLQECIKNIDHKNNSNDKYMLKLMEEVGELAEVIRKNKRMEKAEAIKGTIEEELQDVLYYIVCLANINDIDLQECVYLKEKLNCEKYSRKNMISYKWCRGIVPKDIEIKQVYVPQFPIGVGY